MRQSNYPRGRVLTSPPPEFETKPFRLTSDDLADVTVRSIPLGIRWFWFFAAIYLGFATDFFEHLGQQSAREYRPIFVFIGVWAIDWLLASYKTRRRFRKFFDDPVEQILLDSDRVVAVTNGGLRSSMSSGGNAFYPWEVVKKITMIGEFLTITVAGGLVFIVPKTAFANEDQLMSVLRFSEENGLNGKTKGK